MLYFENLQNIKIIVKESMKKMLMQKNCNSALIVLYIYHLSCVLHYMFLAKLTARIVMGPDYPAVAPLFCVNITWGTSRDSRNDSHILVSI